MSKDLPALMDAVVAQCNRKEHDGPDFIAMNDLAYHKNGHVYYHHGLAPFDQWTLVSPDIEQTARDAFGEYFGSAASRCRMRTF